MAEIYVSLEGYGTARLMLELIDNDEELNGVEVWRGVFSEDSDRDEVLWDVYFEMDSANGYEIWDIINEAIYTFRTETEEYGD